MVFLKAIIEKEDGEVVFSQLRPESGAAVALRAFEAELKAEHGEDAVFHLDDVHYV